MYYMSLYKLVFCLTCTVEYPYIFNAVFFNYTRNHGVDGHWAHMHLGVVLETYIGYGTPRLQTLTALCSLLNH